MSPDVNVHVLPPTPTAKLADALLESDRRYFELGATVEDLDGAELVRETGSRTSHGCVVQRVRPSAIASDPTAWVAEVTRRLRVLACPIARVYLDRPEASLERALAAAGYGRRVEIGFVVEGRLAMASRSDLKLREAVDDATWEAKRRLHMAVDVAPDGHVAAPEEWVDFERHKCDTGEMRAFLVEMDGETCGAVATLEGDGLLRVKNLVVHPRRRRQGIAAATVRLLSERALDLGLAGTGTFGVQGEAGAAVYAGLGMAPVLRQLEWSLAL